MFIFLFEGYHCLLNNKEISIVARHQLGYFIKPRTAPICCQQNQSKRLKSWSSLKQKTNNFKRQAINYDQPLNLNFFLHLILNLVFDLNLSKFALQKEVDIFLQSAATCCSNGTVVVSKELAKTLDTLCNLAASYFSEILPLSKSLKSKK